MPSLRQRALDVLVARLQTAPSLKYVALDRLGFQQLTGDRMPAAFPEARSDSAAEEQPSGHVRDDTPFAVVAYIKAEGGGTSPAGITTAREALLREIHNIMLNTATQDALQAAAATHGGGAAMLGPYYRGIGALDEGQSPPFGFFEWLCSIILHYERGAL